MPRRKSLNRTAYAAAALLTGLWAAQQGFAETVTLGAIADTTLYGESGDQSNGAGNYFFSGRTDNAEVRRALVRFDFSTIPPGSTINSATLTLYCSRTRSQAQNISLHRLTESWGESTSHAPGEEGSGAVAALGDATWTHRIYNTTTWTVGGGTFNAAPSATTSVDNANRFYSWASAGMVADVQAWLNAPAGNHGWIMLGNETTNQTVKRFDSRQSTTVGNRPALAIVYTPPVSASGACCSANGACTIESAFDCAVQGGTYQGDDTACVPNPCPQPTGACCLPNDACVVTTQSDCIGQSGLYRGDGASCTPNPCSGAQQVTLVSMRDNTLYQNATGSVSNGVGIGFFAGTNNQTQARRGLVRFDLTGIPAGSTITDVRLELYLSFTNATVAHDVGIHRVSADWGEGGSDASGNESNGTTAATGDATWLHRFYNTVLWSTVGGDFQATASATSSIGVTLGTYEWTSAGLIGDAQAWVDAPASNFGWLLRGNEALASTQRRFDTREGSVPTQRPTLLVSYVLPQLAGACCLPTGYCVTATADDCAAQNGTYQGDGVDCMMVSCPIRLTPYVDPLPRPAVAQPVTGVSGGAAHYEIAMQEVTQQLHSELPPTRVWGFGGSYPGPTIEARTGLPVTVTWSNDLRDEFGVLRTTHFLPVDTCMHGPDVTGSVPVTVVHLHGGVVRPESDGYPEWTFPPGGQSPLYTYPNNQLASTIWYHDHALGITRLNVYMGLAGFYLVRDDAEDALNLPSGMHEIAMAIQDRSFHPDGSLMYHEMWHEHFFGDFLLVNGKVWPYLNVDQGKYRFRIVNGSTSRVYTLSLSNGATFWQVGTDLGLLPAPVPLTVLTLATGERADLVMDFAGLPAGTEVILQNSAPAPFPGSPGVGVIPNVMKFIVTGQPGHTDPLPAALVAVPPIPETEARRAREFMLRKMFDPVCGHDMWMINDLHWDAITEFPRLGSTEIWSWVNRSGITHPMHLHLVAQQVLDRQDYDVVAGEIVPVGPRIPPPANEAGWKDTVVAMPGQITRVIARFEGYAGLYPYHCHVLEHEDHEMMRQFNVVLAGDADKDGDIDLIDWAFFPDCMAGPQASPMPPPPATADACLEDFDAEFDGDVDMIDFASLQVDFGG